MSNAQVTVVGILALVEDLPTIQTKLIDIGTSMYGSTESFAVDCEKMLENFESMGEEDFSELLCEVFRDNLLLYKATQEEKGNEA